MKYKILLGLLCATCNWGMSQAYNRVIEAMRIDQRINIDGQLDEVIWPMAKVANDFIQQEPTPRDPSAYITEVRVLYDDVNLYIGAQLFDDPSMILEQIVDRDDVGNSDWFYVALDPYGNGTDGFGFLVTAAGGQFDAKLTLQNEDTDWDAVWHSQIQKNDRGWSVEMKIPYSALRFPDKDIQDWKINFGRMVRRSQEKSWWYPVLPDIDGFLTQSGALDGLQGIKSPVRLQATPFVSFIENMAYDPDSDPSRLFSSQLSGGMDIKYGVSDAFTLDMTLIPDFSQVRSDDQVLNLSPFEIFFNENRPFFTEGTEIFSKGDIFYSRRVGGGPYYSGRLNEFITENETVVSTPQTARLVNASKFSGRTNKGLGIGVFNGIERREYATVRDTRTGKEREQLIHPLSNYNVLVLDQNLKNNSTVTLTNAYTYREGDAADANVTALQANLRNKKNTWQFDAAYTYAKRWNEADDTGHNLFLGTKKISGNWRAYMGYNEESENYNINDLGFLQSPNERVLRYGASYVQFTPKHFYNRFGIEFNGRYDRLYKPNEYVGYAFGLESWMVFNNFWRMGLWTWFQPDGLKDYWEPRSDDFSIFWQIPENTNLGGWIRSDSRKRLQAELSMNYRSYNAEDFSRFNIEFEPAFRFSDQFTLEYGIEFNDWRNNFGWVADVDNKPVLGRRDQQVINNELSAQFAFTSNMNINLRARHFWTTVGYNNFYNLDQGAVERRSAPGDYDETFNSFNIDLIYRWRFRPGSDLFITYKNSINQSDDSADHRYFNDLGGLFGLAQQNVLSFKMIFFLDYAEMRGGQGRSASQKDLNRY